MQQRPGDPYLQPDPDAQPVYDPADPRGPSARPMYSDPQMTPGLQAYPDERGYPGQVMNPTPSPAPSALPPTPDPRYRDDPASRPATPGHQHATPERQSWVRLSQLVGRAIVDLGSGRRLGEVEDFVLSPNREVVEGFATRGQFLHGPEAFPARGATVGADAVTLPPEVLQRFDMAHIKGLPLARPLVGMRLLTDTGRVVGNIKDVRYDPQSGAVAFDVDVTGGNFLERLMHHETILPATGIQTFGQDALIVSEASARRYLDDRG